MCACVKMSHRIAGQTSNDADVSANDVDTLSGLLEAAAILMMGIQPALEKVYKCHEHVSVCDCLM